VPRQESWAFVGKENIGTLEQALELGTI